MLSLTNTNTGASQNICLLVIRLMKPPDGRVIFTLVNLPGKEPTVELKYQLLNPSPNFLEVVEEARSVVLAGGTMSPVRALSIPCYGHSGGCIYQNLPRYRMSSTNCSLPFPQIRSPASRVGTLSQKRICRP